jgi:hypothetical protein
MLVMGQLAIFSQEKTKSIGRIQIAQRKTDFPSTDNGLDAGISAEISAARVAVLQDGLGAEQQVLFAMLHGRLAPPEFLAT